MKSHIKKKIGRRVIGFLVILAFVCGMLLPSMTVNATGTESANTKAGKTQSKMSGQKASEKIEENTAERTIEKAERKTGNKANKKTKEESKTKQKVVKIAFPEQEGMSFIGRFGKVTGYNYDYLSKVSEYTG